jgi:hypothetical protein
LLYPKRVIQPRKGGVHMKARLVYLAYSLLVVGAIVAAAAAPAMR